MRRSHSLLLLAGAALAPGCAAPSGGEAGTAPPNVLLIYTDDVGYGDVGCYEGSRTPTPNIDRLAREGIRFTDAHLSLIHI